MPRSNEWFVPQERFLDLHLEGVRPTVSVPKEVWDEVLELVEAARQVAYRPYDPALLRQCIAMFDMLTDIGPHSVETTVLGLLQIEQDLREIRS